MSDDLRGPEKVLVKRKRLTLERIVGDISLDIFLRTLIEIESQSQNKLDDWDNNLVI